MYRKLGSFIHPRNNIFLAFIDTLLNFRLCSKLYSTVLYSTVLYNVHKSCECLSVIIVNCKPNRVTSTLGGNERIYA